jgi:hypothetical protein
MLKREKTARTMLLQDTRARMVLLTGCFLLACGSPLDPSEVTGEDVTGATASELGGLPLLGLIRDTREKIASRRLAAVSLSAPLPSSVDLKANFPTPGNQGWGGPTFLVALGSSLYGIQGDILWRVNPNDGSYTSLGGSIWGGAVGMTALEGKLYIIQLKDCLHPPPRKMQLRSHELHCAGAGAPRDPSGRDTADREPRRGGVRLQRCIAAAPNAEVRSFTVAG